MYLITETIDSKDLDVICEQTEGKPRSYKIEGPFMQSQIKNLNGRIYSRELMEWEVNKYTQEKINTKRSLGEMDHPPSPTINLQKVSHIIESLTMKNNDAMGSAKVLNSPCGKIAQTFLEAGIKLGVSSRGIGSLTGENVNDDYRLLAVDLVCESSAPGAYVNGLIENKEWIMDGNVFVEKAVEKLEENLAKHGSREILRDLKIFLNDIKF